MRCRGFVIVLLTSLLVVLLSSLVVIPSGDALRPFKIAPLQTATGGHFEAVIRASDARASSVYFPNHSGKLSLSVNGNPLPEKELRKISLYQRMAIFDLSPNQDGKPRTLRIEQTLNQNGSGLGAIYLGPTQMLLDQATQQIGLLADVQRNFSVALGFAVVASLFLIFFSLTPLRYFYFLICMLFNVLIDYQSQLHIFGFPLRPFISYIGTGYLLAIALTSNLWWRGPEIERRLSIIFAAGATALLALLDFSFGLDAPQSDLPRILIFVIPAAVISILSLVRSIATLRSGGNWAQIVIGFTSLVFFAFLLNLGRQYLRFPEGITLHVYFWTKSLAAIGIAGLAGAALAHEIYVYRKLRGQVANMSAISAGHHLALDERAKALKAEIELRAVLEERQRFTRDMHDGIGGQLLALMVKARTGALDAKTVEAKLSDSINDLRLVTASLDTADSDLREALAGFAVRVGDQLKGSGITLDWQEAPGLDKLQFPPRKTLELLRVMQEAVTNVIRHSGSTLVTISIGLDAEQKRLVISIADDGSGLPSEWEARQGRGMRNMKDRADRLGGSVAFLPGIGGKGLGIRLTIPTEINPTNSASPFADPHRRPHS